MIADAANRRSTGSTPAHNTSAHSEANSDDHEIPLPSVHYGLREGDLIAFTAQHRPQDSRESRTAPAGRSAPSTSEA